MGGYISLQKYIGHLCCEEDDGLSEDELEFYDQIDWDQFEIEPYQAHQLNEQDFIYELTLENLHDFFFSRAVVDGEKLLMVVEDGACSYVYAMK